MVFLFTSGMDLLTNCTESETMMHNVYTFTHLNRFHPPPEGDSLLPEHSIVANAEKEKKYVGEWLKLLYKCQLEKRGLPKDLVYPIQFSGKDSSKVASLKNMTRQTCGLASTLQPCTDEASVNNSWADTTMTTFRGFQYVAGGYFPPKEEGNQDKDGTESYWDTRNGCNRTNH